MKNKLILLFISAIFITSCTRVNPGEVGLKVNLSGGEKGKSQVDMVYGYVTYFPITSDVITIDVRTQHFATEPFVIQAKGGTNFTVHPSFNYRVNASKVDSLYINWGITSDNLIKSKLLETSLLTAIREVTNTFSVDSVLNNRAGFDHAVSNALDERLFPYATINQFTSGLEPDESMKAAVADKSASIQRAIAAENKKREQQALADLEIIKAKKDSAVVVINAKGEAEAITLKQEALRQSPQYIDLVKAQKWDGQLPATMLGSGTRTLFNLK